MGDVLAVPDSLAVRLLDDSRVVEAPRLSNVRRLQVGSHNHPILLSAQRGRPAMTHWKYAVRDRRVQAFHHFPGGSVAPQSCLRGDSAVAPMLVLCLSVFIP